MHQNLDIVDVHLSSKKDTVDALFIEPLLDNSKKYTVECTEFQCSLHDETTLPPPSFFTDVNGIREEHLILRVKRRYVSVPATAPGHDHTLLTSNAGDPNFNVYVAAFAGIDTTFVADDTKPCQHPSDMLYYLQRFFDDIKAKYVASVGGVLAALHGGTAWAITAEENFVTVELNPNGTFRLYLAPNFCKHFWCELSQFGANLLGYDTKYLAFATVGGVLRRGWHALTGNPAEGAGAIIAGTTGETIALDSMYPLERNFDHRIALELTTALPIPPTIVWSTNDSQQVSHKLATFTINNKTTSTGVLDSEGGPHYCSNSTPLLTGDILWRRAEDKVSERYEMLNSQFIQNIRLSVYIFRRIWNSQLNEYKIKRLPITILEGDSWTAKLRFRTL